MTGTWLLIEYAADSDQSKLRILQLEWNQLSWCVLAGCINVVGLACKTTAYANERPGLITMVGYIGLVYAISVDVLIFKESFTVLEIVGVALILIANVTVICSKQQKS